uniref:Uncharacterized protein n=1 Tax=Setaria italica TaxID=4555 RepID=K4A3L4_SETIT
MAVAVSVRTQLDAVICATNGSSSNGPVFRDPQSASKPRESEIEETNTENGVCASQSKATSGDEEVPIDQDSPACQKRKSGNANGDNEDASTYQTVRLARKGSQEKLPTTMERLPQKRTARLPRVASQEKPLLTTKRFPQIRTVKIVRKESQKLLMMKELRRHKSCNLLRLKVAKQRMYQTSLQSKLD